MPQVFCAYSSTPDCYEVLLGASGQILLHSLADDYLTWQDGTTGTIAADTLATSAYGGNSVDNTAAVYYLLVKKGTAVPVLLKESDIASADTVLGGTPSWAKRLRIENGVPMPTPQP